MSGFSDRDKTYTIVPLSCTPGSIHHHNSHDRFQVTACVPGDDKSKHMTEGSSHLGTHHALHPVYNP